MDRRGLCGVLTDFRGIKEQEHVKRATEVAAAGGHNMLMVRPPARQVWAVFVHKYPCQLVNIVACWHGQQFLFWREIAVLSPDLDTHVTRQRSIIHSQGGFK